MTSDSLPAGRKLIVVPDSSEANKSPGRPSLVQNRWALLVGINRYIDPTFTPLNFCVNDVLALEKLLKQLGYTVVCLHDELERDSPRFPTRDNIEAELTRLCGSVGVSDLLLVHFACHGTLVDRQPVLITQETRHVNLAKRALSLAEVEVQMRSSSASRLVLTLDACHTGAELGREVSNPDFIRNAYELAEGFVLIAASTAQQVAQEWQTMRHGVFTYYLLEGLSGKADQGSRGFVSVNDLQTYVLDSLRRWNVKHSGQVQEPTVRSEGMGDMILADYRSHPAGKTELPAEGTKLQRLSIRCKLRTAVLTSLGVATALICLRFLGQMQFLELKLYDHLMQSRLEPQADPRLLVIEVNSADLAAQKSRGEKMIGSFSNETLTKLLEKLKQFNPRAIGFDFYREDSFDVKRYPVLDQQMRTQSNLFLLCKTSSTTLQVSGIPQPPNVPLERVGFSDFILDEDGVLRRQFLAFQPDANSPCKTETAFSLLLASHYLEKENMHYENPITSDEKCQDLVFSNDKSQIRFPNFLPYTGGYQGVLEEQAGGCQVLLNYRSHENVALRYTLSQILNNDPKVSVADLQNRIILVGIVHRDTVLDYWETPYGSSDEQQMAGVLIQANMVSQILSAVLGDRGLIWVLPQWGEMLWIAFWSGVGGALGWWWRSPRSLMIAIGVTNLGLYVTCLVSFQFVSGWLPLLPCILGVAIVGASVWWLSLQVSLVPVSNSD